MSEESTERGSGDRNKAEIDEIESFFCSSKVVRVVLKFEVGSQTGRVQANKVR